MFGCIISEYKTQTTPKLLRRIQLNQFDYVSTIMVFSLLKITAAYRKSVKDCYYKLYYDQVYLSEPCEQCTFHVVQRDCAQIFYEQSAQRIWNTDWWFMSSMFTCDVPTESENGEPERPINEIQDVEVVDIEEQNGNEGNGQVMGDDQNEEVEVVEYEETPFSEDDELELMIEEPRDVKPANVWISVDINDPIVQDIAERAVLMNSEAAEITKDLHLRFADKHHIKGCVYKLSLDLTGPDGVVKCNVVVTDHLYFKFKKVKFVEWNPVEPWSRSKVDTKDGDHLLSGDFYEVDVNDVIVQDMAYYAVAHLNDKKLTDQ